MRPSPASPPTPDTDRTVRTSRFPWPLLLLALCLGLGIFAVHGWQLWHLGEDMWALQERHSRLKSLSHQLVDLSERLSTSASLYAATGGTLWKDRYLESRPELEGVLLSMLDMGDQDTVLLAERVQDVVRSLEDMESRAMEWADRGQGQPAMNLLGGMEYAGHKRQLVDALRELDVLLLQRAVQARENLTRDTRVTMFVTLGAIPGLALLFALAGILIYRYLRSRQLAQWRMEAGLAEVRARYQAVVENMNDGLAVYRAVDQGRDFEFTAFNAGAEAIDGMDRGVVLGRRLTEAFPGAEDFGLLEVLRRVHDTGQSEHFPMAFYQDGNIQGWRDNFVFRLPSGEVAAVYTDSTEQKQAQEALEQSEVRYRNLYNKTPIMLHSIDAEGRLVSVSDYWLAVMGYRREEVVGRDLTDFFTEESRIFAKETALPNFFRTGQCADVPYRIVTREGRVLDVLLSATSERDAKGKLIRSLAVLVDVTARKQAEQALAESEERLKLAMYGGRVGFWDWDVASDTVVYNEQWAAIIGFGLAEIESSYDFWAERIHPEDLEKTQQALQDHLQGASEYFESEHRLRAKDGRWRWVLGLGRVTRRNEAGEPLRVSGVMMDLGRLKEAESHLKRSRERFRNVALTSGDWIWEIDAQGRYVYASESVERILGYEAKELLGKTPYDLMTKGDKSRIAHLFGGIVERREPIVDLENWNTTKDGRRICLLTSGVPVYDDQGEFAGYFGVDKDITERKDQEYKLQLFGRLFEAAQEGITINDPAGNILEVNQAFSDITGYSRQEALGKNPRILKSDRHSEGFYQAMWADLLSKGSWEGEIWNRRKNGEAYPEWLSISAIRDEDGHVSHYVSVFHDITEMKRKEEQIRYQANHDALTGLPNRSLFLDRLQVVLARARRAVGMAAVVYVDLDNFKTINDSLGHAMGDKLLLAVAERFTRVVREGDTVARLGGDEFVFLLDNIHDPTETVQVARRVLDELERPIVLDGRDLFITPSIGIALYPQDGTEPDSLLKHADLAMYQAKELGRNRYRLFTSELNERARRRLDMEGDLRRALNDGDLFLMYQPKVDVAGRRVRGMEALVRWQRGDEVIGPDEFIPLAEETGLIVPLGEYVLELACRQCRGLLEGQEPGFTMAVNLSPRQFRKADILEMVSRTLMKHDLSSERLELEITESMLVGDLDDTVKKLRSFREMGVGIAVDDFGTGYSSLAYLKHFPLSTLKIDRAFVMNLGTDEGDRNIVKTVIQLAQNFGLTVVAEGVEDSLQYNLLESLGCDMIQGFLISKPLRFGEFAAFLKGCDPCKFVKG